MLPASIGALAALLVVVALGLWLHSPLARVPENSLKFGVGVLRTAFGTFRVGEGVGVDWPRADEALLALVAAYLVVALLLVPVFTRLRGVPRSTSKAAAAPVKEAKQGVLALIGSELLGLFIDDRWLVHWRPGLGAAGVVRGGEAVAVA